MTGHKDRTLLRIILALFGGLFVVVLALFILWLPRKTHASISGKVIDQQSGEPVANARVIVTLVSNGFPYESFMGYGLRADKHGRFALDVVAPRRFSRVFVEASAPNDDYALVSPAGEHVILRTAPLPASKRESPRLHYKEFRGLAGFGDGNPLKFVEDGW